eukprot:6211380-Pleurochrysis_carterae.AAC.2
MARAWAFVAQIGGAWCRALQARKARRWQTCSFRNRQHAYVPVKAHARCSIMRHTHLYAHKNAQALNARTPRSGF